MAVRLETIPLLTAVTATTTSPAVNVTGARRVGVLLRAAAITSGNGAFALKGSLDDMQGDPKAVAMTTLNMFLDNVTNTNAQNLTRVSAKTLSANGDAFLWLDQNCLINWLQVTVTRTTDGTYSAYLVIERPEV